jgi:hypothetical protein
MAIGALGGIGGIGPGGVGGVGGSNPIERLLQKLLGGGQGQQQSCGCGGKCGGSCGCASCGAKRAGGLLG